MATTEVNRAVHEFRRIVKGRAQLDYAEQSLQGLVNRLNGDDLSDYVRMTDEITNAVELATAEAEQSGHASSTARVQIAYAANHAGLDRKVKI